MRGGRLRSASSGLIGLIGLIGFGGLGGLTGCRDRTEIMLGILTDLRAPDVLDSVHIQVANGGVPLVD